MATTIGVIKGDTRSLDYSSQELASNPGNDNVSCAAPCESTILWQTFSKCLATSSPMKSAEELLRLGFQRV